jgi:hypothetical protein
MRESYYGGGEVPDSVDGVARQEGQAKSPQIKPLVRGISNSPIVEVEAVDIYVSHHRRRLSAIPRHWIRLLVIGPSSDNCIAQRLDKACQMGRIVVRDPPCRFGGRERAPPGDRWPSHFFQAMRLRVAPRACGCPRPVQALIGLSADSGGGLAQQRMSPPIYETGGLDRQAGPGPDSVPPLTTPSDATAF